MPYKQKLGEIVYIVENNCYVRELRVLKAEGGFYTMRFADKDAGIKLRKSRLFPTREEAETSLPELSGLWSRRRR